MSVTSLSQHIAHGAIPMKCRLRPVAHREPDSKRKASRVAQDIVMVEVGDQEAEHRHRQV